LSRAGVARGVVFFAALASLPLLGLEHWVLNLLIFTLMYAALASSWNLVGGFAGYPSLGHAAFFGIGAYTVGVWMHHHAFSSGYEPFLILPFVGLAVAVLAIPVALIAMRTRASVFAIVTITLLFVTQTLAFNLRTVTGGAQGLALPIPPFRLAIFERPFYYALLILLLVSMSVTFGLMRSKVGLSLQAVSADEDKARGVGVHVMGVKLLAFAFSVGLAAMVGGVWAYYESFIYPQFAIDPLVTIGMVLMTFLGGRATLWGPVVGAFVLEPGHQYLAYRLGGSQFYLIAYAGAFLVIMLLLPRGILPTLTDRIRRRRQAGERNQSAGDGVVRASAIRVPEISVVPGGRA
jgi:branched-chain amino acid transport system permease protein